jgi:hypothetical protein
MTVIELSQRELSRVRIMVELDDGRLSSIKVKGDGSVEVRLWNKVEVLTTMARHLGLFEKDNSQQAPNLALVANCTGDSAANTERYQQLKVSPTRLR